MTDTIGTINSQFVLLTPSNTPEPHTGGISANDVIFAKPLQPWKADSSMLVTLLGNVSSVKPLQPWKAYSPMLHTLFGNVSSVKPLQPRKAEATMRSKVFGNVSSVKPLQPSKAQPPMLVTLLAM